MGNVLFGGKRARAHSRAIEEGMKDEFQATVQGIKVLLLGPTNAGKSTFVKQLRILYGDPYRHEELMNFRRQVHSNALSFLAQLHELAVLEGHGVHSEKDTHAIYCLSPAAEIEKEDLSLVKRMWTDPGIQQAYLDRAKAEISESAEFFINRVDEIASEDYLPPHEHILRLRVPTLRLTTTEMRIDGIAFTFFDASAQENKRGKWLHLFNAVQVVIFVASLADFDVMSKENPNENKLAQSISSLKQLMQEPELREVTIMVILNKSDILGQKLFSIDPAAIRNEITGDKPWADYTGGIKSTKGFESYIIDKIKKSHSRKKAPLYFVSNATNSNEVKTIFSYMENAIIQNYMKQSFFSTMSVSATATDKMSKFKRAGMKASLQATSKLKVEE
jgi:GTPase SAR1 family protein